MTVAHPLRFRAFVAASAAAHFAFFLLRFVYLWLDDVVREQAGTALAIFVEEATGALGGFLLSPLVLLVWMRWPLRRGSVWRRLPGYLALGAASSVANTSFMWGTRSLLFPMLGLGAYDYGRMPLRYLMELPGALIGFATLVAVIALMESIHRRHQDDQARAALERTLVETQLHNLRLQLQPHFLFNAINTISERVHENAAEADRLLGGLAELLRASLRTGASQLVPFADERALLIAYLDLMSARFGARLRVETSIDAAADVWLVPPLLLQPLVENAVRHGGLETRGHVHVNVAARVEGERLSLVVRDDGPGMSSTADPLGAGTGLSATVRRLQLLFGASATMRAGNHPDGGFEVLLSIPSSAR